MGVLVSKLWGMSKSIDPRNLKVGDSVSFMSHKGTVIDMGPYKQMQLKYSDAITVAGPDVDDSKFGHTFVIRFDDGMRLIGSFGVRLLLKGGMDWVITKAKGTCKRGERADLTGCTPASGSGGKKPGAKDDAAGDKKKDKKTKKAPPPKGEKEAPAPCCLYDPDPEKIDPVTGIAGQPRVGVGGSTAPPPPNQIPRLPGLVERERRAETSFADAYLYDPDGIANRYRDLLKAGKIGDAPNIFNTDDVKVLSPDYNPQGVSDDEAKDARSTLNVAVHQTANAIAKRAFIQHLDTLPKDSEVLVTSGGVASGKGFALANAEGTSELAGKVGAVWDAAGEQNAAENPWVMDECKKRGLKPIFAFVHADPIQTWENPDRGVVERAGKKGRMVDGKLFADSYAIGARNFQAFYEKNKGDAEFIFIDNATGGKPKVTDKMPEAALKVNGEELYARANSVIKDRADNIKPAVLRGGTIGERLWGKPQKTKKPTTRKPKVSTEEKPKRKPIARKPKAGLASRLGKSITSKRWEPGTVVSSENRRGRILELYSRGRDWSALVQWDAGDKEEVPVNLLDEIAGRHTALHKKSAPDDKDRMLVEILYGVYGDEIFEDAE